MPENEAFYRAAERRIEYLTLVAGTVAAIVAAWQWGWPYGAGVLVGAVLSWVNFRWLKQALHVMTALAEAQPDPARARIPASVYVKFFARYALLIVVVYVIFSRSWLPTTAVLAGLFTVVAGVMLEMMYQLARREPRDAS